MRNNYDYYSALRHDLLIFFPARVERVLSIGCGIGEIEAWLKENGLCRWIAGVQISSNAARIARDKLDVVYEGNAEEIKLDIAQGSIDVIICADILEHFINPWKYLSKLRPLLREGGIIIGCFPNVRYWKVSMGLLFGGRWAYKDTGVLDQTHLPFFVRRTILSLFEEAGFAVKNIKSLRTQLNWSFASWAVNLITFGFFSDLLTVQYIIVASN